METSGATPPISAREAAASLAAVHDSRRRARRAEYPVWFWLATGIGLAAVPLCAGKGWPPSPWGSILSWADLALGVAVAIAAFLRARGLRAYSPVGMAACLREVRLVMWPFVSYVVVLLAGTFTWQRGLWPAPLAPLVTAGAAFAGWAGFGLAATTFSMRLPPRR